MPYNRSGGKEVPEHMQPLPSGANPCSSGTRAISLCPHRSTSPAPRPLGRQPAEPEEPLALASPQAVPRMARSLLVSWSPSQARNGNKNWMSEFPLGGTFPIPILRSGRERVGPTAASWSPARGGAGCHWRSWELLSLSQS